MEHLASTRRAAAPVRPRAGRFVVPLLVGGAILGLLHLVRGSSLAVAALRRQAPRVRALGERLRASQTAAPAAAPSRSSSRAPRGVRIAVTAALGTTAAAVLGIVVAFTGIAGSYAYLNAAKPVNGATVASGSFGITVNGAATAAVSTAAWSKLLPGDTMAQTVTVANTGSAGAVLTASSTATAPWVLTLGTGACGSAQPSSASGTVLSTTASAALVTVAAGASQPLCLQATLPSTVAASAAGTSTAFTVTVNGTQASS